MRLFLLVAALGLTACTTLGTVTPRPNNQADIIGQGASEQDAIKQANATAKKHCESKKQSYAVIESKTAYKGLVSERANKTIDAVQSIAYIASGKVLPTLASDTDYTVTMTIKCE